MIIGLITYAPEFVHSLHRRVHHYRDLLLALLQEHHVLLLDLSFMDSPLTIIEELIDRVLVWRAGTQNSQAQEYSLRQLRWDDYFAT